MTVDDGFEANVRERRRTARQRAKAVHYMCVTSMCEVHDHKGHWKDGGIIKFEPLRAGMMGRQVIETLRWQFTDVNSLDKISTVTMSDGSAMIFEFKGKRRK